MEILIALVVIALIYFYISNNSRKIEDETVIKTTQTIKTANGEQTITRTTVMNSSQMDIRSPNTPMMPVNHKIIEPSEREPSLPQTLEKQNTLKHQQMIGLNNNEPKYIQQKQSNLDNLRTPEIAFKECSGCKRVQPISEFRANPNKPDGLTKWCNHCMKNGAPNPTNMKGKKVCEKCGQTRMKTSFYPTTKYPDGLSRWCKFCLPNKRK